MVLQDAERTRSDVLHQSVVRIQTRSGGRRINNVDHVFLLRLSDEEITLIRRASRLTGRKFSNVCHDCLMSEVRKTIEDAEMLKKMAREDECDRSEKDCIWESDS